MPESPWQVRGARITPRALWLIWSDKRVRASVFGYFGHMWKLYAFFILVPLMVATRLAGSSVSAGSFWVMLRVRSVAWAAACWSKWPAVF